MKETQKTRSPVAPAAVGFPPLPEVRPKGRWDELPFPREPFEERRGFSTERTVFAGRRGFLL